MDYNQRLAKSYDYCSERAVGFYYTLKKNIILTPPEFIKYTGVRNPGWVFFDRKVKNNRDLTVLLNYNNKNEIFLEKLIIINLDTILTTYIIIGITKKLSYVIKIF